MKYLFIIILIGIALYYAMKWQRPSQERKKTPDNSDKDPYRSNKSARKQTGNSYAKWVGGGLGWAFGGPIGALLGFMFGSMYDGMNKGSGAYGETRQGDFAVSLLVLTAAVMKADGSVKKSELNYVKEFYRANFGAEKAGEYIKILGELLKQQLDVQQVGLQIRQHMDYSARMMLVQYLFGISHADGSIHLQEIDIIRTISGYMGINPNDFESIKAMFVKEIGSAYKILEVSTDASDEEIKHSYRELAKKYHPDKVAHLGEEVKQAAEEKFTKLNAAYEAIKEERGIN